MSSLSLGCLMSARWYVTEAARYQTELNRTELKRTEADEAVASKAGLCRPKRAAVGLN